MTTILKEVAERASAELNNQLIPRATGLLDDGKEYELIGGKWVEMYPEVAPSDDDKEYELIGGKLIEMLGPSFRHGAIILTLGQSLKNYIGERKIGRVTSNIPFILGTDDEPRPDVAFVVQERLAAIDFDDAFPGRPDIAVEVVSRTDTVFGLDDKIALYLKFDTPLVWVIDPRSQLVFVYRTGATKPTVLDVADELDGESILPSFKLKVAALFE